MFGKQESDSPDILLDRFELDKRVWAVAGGKGGTGKTVLAQERQVGAVAIPVRGRLGCRYRRIGGPQVRVQVLEPENRRIVRRVCGRAHGIDAYGRDTTQSSNPLHARFSVR